MASTFSAIVDDFDQELTSLKKLVEIGQDRSLPPRTRVASIHATNLMLAAAFEEFIREMAREQAKQVVERADSIANVPDKLLETAWMRTLGELARAESVGLSKKEALRKSAKQARPKVEALLLFVEGDLKQNIYDHLIHNESNMRPDQVNKLFKVSGLGDICRKVCHQASLKEYFEQENEDKMHGDLLMALNSFINHRNKITHSLNSVTSEGPDEVFRVIEMFRAFAKDLYATLEPAVG